MSGQVDSVAVTGTVTLAQRHASTLALIGSFHPVNRTTFTIIANDDSDAVIGTFAGLAEGAAVFSLGGNSYVITYAGGDGNDVVHTVPARARDHIDGGGAIAVVPIAENTTAVTVVTATDPDSTPTFSIAGGADAALFQIDATTGVLSFITAPDFEAPTDADGDNSYEVVVRASDGALFDDQTITLNVVNVNEAPESLQRQRRGRNRRDDGEYDRSHDRRRTTWRARSRSLSPEAMTQHGSTSMPRPVSCPSSRRQTSRRRPMPTATTATRSWCVPPTARCSTTRRSR